MAALLDLPNEILHKILEILLLLEQIGFETSSQVIHAKYLRRRKGTHSSTGRDLSHPWEVTVDRYENGLRIDVHNSVAANGIASAIKQAMQEQHATRVSSGSLIGGTRNHPHQLRQLNQQNHMDMQAAMLNSPLQLDDVLALAATCRRLRAVAEPVLYRVAHFKERHTNKGLSQWVELLGKRPELADHVRSLCLATSLDHRYADIVFASPSLTADVAQLLRDILPDHFGFTSDDIELVALWDLRFTLLLQLPRLRYLQLEYSDAREFEGCFLSPLNQICALGTRRACTLLAIQTLQEVSLIEKRTLEPHWLEAHSLVPLFMLPRIHTLRMSGLHADTNTECRMVLDAHKEAIATSNLKELLLDFTLITAQALHLFLQLPRALETFHLSDGYINPFESRLKFADLLDLSDDSEDDSDDENLDPATSSARELGQSLLRQRRSLKDVSIRGIYRDYFDVPIEVLRRFACLEEVQIPVRSLLGRGEQRHSMVDSLPRSLRRLTILANPATQDDNSWLRQLRDVILRKKSDFLFLEHVAVEQCIVKPINRQISEEMWDPIKIYLAAAGLRAGVKVRVHLNRATFWQEFSGR